MPEALRGVHNFWKSLGAALGSLPATTPCARKKSWARGSGRVCQKLSVGYLLGGATAGHLPVIARKVREKFHRTAANAGYCKEVSQKWNICPSRATGKGLRMRGAPCWYIISPGARAGGVQDGLSSRLGRLPPACQGTLWSWLGFWMGLLRFWGGYPPSGQTQFLNPPQQATRWIRTRSGGPRPQQCSPKLSAGWITFWKSTCPRRCVHENFQGPEASVEFARSLFWKVYWPQSPGSLPATRRVRENSQGPEASAEFTRSFPRGVHNFWDRREPRPEVYLPQRPVCENFQ